mgnify:FL=1
MRKNLLYLMLSREEPLRSLGPLDFLTVPHGEGIEALHRKPLWICPYLYATIGALGKDVLMSTW